MNEVNASQLQNKQSTLTLSIQQRGNYGQVGIQPRRATLKENNCTSSSHSIIQVNDTQPKLK